MSDQIVRLLQPCVGVPVDQALVQNTFKQATADVRVQVILLAWALGALLEGLVGFGYPGPDPDFGALRAWEYTPVPNPSEDPTGKRTGHAAEFLRAVETELTKATTNLMSDQRLQQAWKI